jgi:hypothetical protein
MRFSVESHYVVMAAVSFALYEAFRRGASIDALADRLGLTAAFVTERIEAARLCMLLLDREIADQN